MKKQTILIIICGFFVGLAALALTLLGNPANMGFCIACFERDIAGSLGLHGAEKLQYLRPEIVGLVLGSFIISLCTREFRPKAGSSPVTRFLIGMTVMIGALLFLGCPLRMVIRLAGGDLNALVALAGFVLGILIGVCFLKKGFSLGRNYPARRVEGGAFPVLMLGLLLLFPILKASVEGPASMHAPFFASLGIALLIGAFCQRTRLCMAGGIRDAVMFGDRHLAAGFGAVFVTILVGNLCLGNFHLGFEGQPVAHSEHLWNLIGMVIVGWGSVLLGGCPLRQLILAGGGNADSGVSVLGMLAGAALAHNLSLAASGDGVPANGKIAAGVCAALLLAISVLNCKEEAK